MISGTMARWAFLAASLSIGACDRHADRAAPESKAGAEIQSEPASANPTPSSQLNPLLQSEALKDAIHRASTTGQNQRWQDGELSGYAVPSRELLPNGCRTIRYTVDQRPDAPMMTINACEGSR
jgi:hypothetical protein